MSEHKATLAAGGVADWGEFMETESGLSSFTYSTEGTVRLSIDGRGDFYFYGYMTGMDHIDSDHIVTEGFGNMRFTDIDGDCIFTRVDWFWKDDKDQGVFRLFRGTGKWKGISGEIAVVLKPALTGSESRFGAFMEGEGAVVLA